jgi:hypothetical protein
MFAHLPLFAVKRRVLIQCSIGGGAKDRSPLQRLMTDPECRGCELVAEV